MYHLWLFSRYSKTNLHRLYYSQSLKYLLSGPLQKKKKEKVNFLGSLLKFLTLPLPKMFRLFHIEEDFTTEK